MAPDFPHWLCSVQHLLEAVDLWSRTATREQGSLRTVIVSSESLAHAFRRELALDPGIRALLVGTRFVRAVDLAEEWLLLAGEVPAGGAEEVRLIALETLFAGKQLEDRLQYFKLHELRKGAGYAEAFAATLQDLSCAGADADALRQAATTAPDDVSRGRCLDLAAVLESLRLTCLDRHQILRRAAALPSRERGPVFAFLEREPEPSELVFLHSIPGIRAALLTARPLGLMKNLVPSELPPPSSPAVKSELTILHRDLFAAPEELGQANRIVSDGPDGSLHLEIHSGVDDELSATATWVAEQVRRGTPLERIAVLVPAADPLAGMVYDRLAGLPWETEEPPLHVSGGLPAVTLPVGQRMRVLLEALESGLRVEELFRVLPSLRFDGTVGEFKREHLNPAEARRLVWSCGTLGGSPERPADAAQWVLGLEGLVARLEELADLEAPSDELEREVKAAKRNVGPFRAVLPAVRDLAALAGLVAAGESLARIWAALEAFWKRRAISLDRVGFAEELSRRVAPLLAFDRRGRAALSAIRRCAEAIRWRVGRFGEPRVFIGTAEQAAGIPFDAVRLIGLAEGAVAGAPVEDPLLPDSDRARISPPLRRAADRPPASLRAVSRAVRHTAKRLVLSAPRQTVDDTVREASILFLEVAGTLRRPNAVTGKREDGLPDAQALECDYLHPARLAHLEHLQIRRARPATADLAIFLDADRTGSPGPLDGQLRDHRPPIRTCSPSSLKTLLECPHRFLFERVFHWEEPDELPDVRQLDALTFGSLFHAIVENFFKAHATEFYGRTQSLENWQAKAVAIADAEFDRLVQSHPLAGGAARERERTRAREAIALALRHEWDRGLGIEVARSEARFGWDGTLSVCGLPVRGAIDRVDTIGEMSVIRDFKTGKSHPRKSGEAPDPATDIQLAVYALAVRALAKEWRLPAPGAVAYVYPVARPQVERAFEGLDFDRLLKAGEGWVALARRLLDEGSFPRTASKEDCKYCPFKPVCGPEAPLATPGRWSKPSPAVAEFLELKSGGGESEQAPADPELAKKKNVPPGTKGKRKGKS